MKTIWKYPITIGADEEFVMPKGSTVLHFGVQNDEPRIWVLIDTNAENESRRFVTYGTGHPIKHANLEHIGTILMWNDSLVWHLFEVKEEKQE